MVQRGPVDVIEGYHPYQLIEGTHLLNRLTPQPEIRPCLYPGGGCGYTAALSLRSSLTY